MLRILVADNHEIVRHGLRDVIATHHDWEVCGEAGDGSQALEIARHERPGVAIVAVSLPKLDGPSLIGRLGEECPDTRVLVFSMHEAHATVERCLGAGALGYVLKTEAEHQLTAAIAAVGSQRRYLSPRVLHILQEADEFHQSRAKDRFTSRERQLMQLISEGYTNKDMARAWGLSIKTIETHRGTAMAKANARNGIDLVRYAIKQGIIPGDDASPRLEPRGQGLDPGELRLGVRGRKLTSTTSAP